jgi:hypothetical protein
MDAILTVVDTEGDQPMSEAYLTNWLASHATDDRNHFHEVAIHEARIATEARARAAAAPARLPSLLGRLRAAIPGPTPAERCDCAAAA